MVKCDFLGDSHIARMLPKSYNVHERPETRSSSELAVNVGLDPTWNSSKSSLRPDQDGS